jgi:hypothetical protein
MSPHPIVHIEFSAKDREAAAQFYADAFGWKVEQNPEFNYATFEPGEGVAGGFNPITDRYPAGTVVVYIGTDDIEASLAKVESLGGKVMATKTEIPGIGWFGLFQDPTGNLVGLYTAMPGQA